MTNYEYEYYETTTILRWQDTQDELERWSSSAGHSTGHTNGNTSTDMWITATHANESNR
jgi:hypothetical protein